MYQRAEALGGEVEGVVEAIKYVFHSKSRRNISSPRCATKIAVISRVRIKPYGNESIQDDPKEVFLLRRLEVIYESQYFIIFYRRLIDYYVLEPI